MSQPNTVQSLQANLKKLHTERDTLTQQRLGCMRDSNAYKRKTQRIHKLDKRIAYLDKCVKKIAQAELRKTVLKYTNIPTTESHSEGVENNV